MRIETFNKIGYILVMTINGVGLVIGCVAIVLYLLGVLK